MHRSISVLFGSAIKGYGGCPMADDNLIVNMPTEKLIIYFTEDLGLDIDTKFTIRKVISLNNYLLLYCSIIIDIK